MNTDFTRSNWRLPIGFLLLATSAAGDTLAATYSFTNITDSTVPGAYFGFRDAAISGNKIAFMATYDQGFLGYIDTIFTSTGGPRTRVVQELTNAPPANGYNLPGLFSAIGRPSISGNTVVFTGHVSGTFQGIEADAIFSGGEFYGPTGPAVYLSVGTQFFGSYPYQYSYRSVTEPRISEGTLIFRGSETSSSVPDSLYTKYASSRIVGVGDPAPPGGTFSGISADYGTSGENATFRGFYGTQEGIFTGKSGGPLTTIAKKGDPTPIGGTFETLIDPAISGTSVAFVGTSAGGTGIFASDGGPLTTVVKTGDATPSGGTISSLSTPAIAGNLVAFRADYSGGSGIYTKNGGVLSKVIETGDPLFGSTVTSFTFTDLGVDAGGSGNLAFTYGLANGRSGVAMAYTGAAPPAIYQWAYSDPAHPEWGKFQSAVPVVDGIGVVAVPVVNLASRNLTKAYLIGAQLGGANANSANLTDADLSSAVLTNANLSNANLSGAILDAAPLSGANFGGANVRGASVRRVLTVSVCSGNDPFCVPMVNGSYGGITPAQLYQTANYVARDLTDVRLPGNDLTSANLTNQNLTRADFTGAWLASANFAGATIQGARFGRYTITAGCEGKPAVDSCRAMTNIIGTGVSVAQLTSTASYAARDLASIDVSGNVLSGGNFTEQNLTGASFLGTNVANANFSSAAITNVNFRSATLTGANLGGADARGADFSSAVMTGAVLANLIQSDGHVSGLNLGAGQSLVVRDYDGDPSRVPALAPIEIRVDQQFAISAGGKLRTVFESDAWDSKISFAAGIPVSLNGTLELAFSTGTSLLGQIGRTIDLFDWTGVTPTGAFVVSSPYTWNLTNLYTTGEVTLLAIPALPGDFNSDGTVDAADYVVWRKGLGSSYTPAQYNEWRANFGRMQTAGSGAALPSAEPLPAAVPEPTAEILLLLAAIGVSAWLSRWRPEHHQLVALWHTARN